MTALGTRIVALTMVSLTVLIGIVWLSRRRNIEVDAKDYFSAGKTLGFIVISLSVFADSYMCCH
jgi:sodium/pantothenate symporter